MGLFGRPVVLVGLLAAMGAGNVGAQGVTTAALYGVVHGSESSGIGDAMVTVTNTADGERWRTTTHADGRYAFEYLSVGGPAAPALVPPGAPLAPFTESRGCRPNRTSPAG